MKRGQSGNIIGAESDYSSSHPPMNCSGHRKLIPPLIRSDVVSYNQTKNKSRTHQLRRTHHDGTQRPPHGEGHVGEGLEMLGELEEDLDVLLASVRRIFLEAVTNRVTNCQALQTREFAIQDSFDNVTFMIKRLCCRILT